MDINNTPRLQQGIVDNNVDQEPRLRRQPFGRNSQTGQFMTSRALELQDARLSLPSILTEGTSVALRNSGSLNTALNDVELVFATEEDDAFQQHDVLATAKKTIQPALQKNLDLGVDVVKQIFMMGIAPDNQPLSPHRRDAENARNTTMSKVRALGEFAAQDFLSIRSHLDRGPQLNFKLATALVLLGREAKYGNDDNQVHSGANCGECAGLATYLVMRQDNNPSIDFYGLKRAPDAPETVEEPDHAFIVIGRDQETTDPKDITTWNKEAAVVDPYLRLVCPADELNDISEFIDDGFALSHEFYVPANVEVSQAFIDGDLRAVPIQTPWLDD